MNHQNNLSNKQPNKPDPQDNIFSSQTEPNLFASSNPNGPKEFEIFAEKTEPDHFHSMKEPKTHKFTSSSTKATSSSTKLNDLAKDQQIYSRKRPAKKKTSKRKWVAITLSSLFGLIFVYLVVIAFQAYLAISSGFTELSPSKLRGKAINMEQDAFSILLLGTDERQPNAPDWHPDSLMVAIINPKAHSIKIISIPRDLKVKLSTGEITKINQTATVANKYGLDPYKVTRETVENFLNIPIDHFIRVNFASFEGIIDAVDGITVNVERPFSAKMIGYAPATFKKGLNHLNGSEALTYARERKQDPLGDIGRSARQRQIVVALTEKLTKPTVFFSLPGIASSLNGNIKHNFKLSDFYTLAKIYQESKSNLQLLAFNSKSAEIGDDWFELWTNEERITVSTTLQKHLEYKPVKPLEPSPLMEKEEQFASRDDDQDYPDFLAELDEKKEKNKIKNENKKENKKTEKDENGKEETELAKDKEKTKKKLAENRKNRDTKIAEEDRDKDRDKERSKKVTIATDQSKKKKD